LLLLCGLLLPLLLPAQNRQELEQRRQQLLQEIKATEKALGETKQNKVATLEQYAALKTQIQKRQALISTLRAEVENANNSIARSEEVLRALKLDIERLKAEYAHTIRIAYRHKLSKSMLVFLFSADSFNDAFRRWQYVRQYDRFRKKQAYNIIETRDMLARRTVLLEERRQEQEQLLASQEQQRQLLGQALKDKDQILKQLNSSEAKLAADLSKKQQAHEELNKDIENIIVAELARKRREARAGTPSASGEAEAGSPKTSVAASEQLTSAFKRMRGQLPWPVKQGRISKPFGRTVQLEENGLKLPNNGVEISAGAQASIYPVFEGEVTHITFVPIYQNAILLNHGDFFTLYYRIEEVFVKKGQKVGPDEAIGKLSRENDTVHFEIWQGTTKLDPAQWIKKR
jgi:murein hydrolase activator